MLFKFALTEWQESCRYFFFCVCVWIRSIHPTSRSSRVCACIRFNITRGEKHRGDTAKNQYLVLELKETKKKSLPENTIV